jgi:iron complex outermembrane receptor protein
MAYAISVAPAARRKRRTSSVSKSSRVQIPRSTGAGIGSFHGHTHYTNVLNYGLDPTTGDLPLAPWVGHQAIQATQGFAQVNGQFDTFGVKHDLLVGGDSLQDTTTFRYFVNGFAPIGTFNIYAPWATFIDYGALSSQYPDYWSGKSERWNGLFIQDQITIMERAHLLVRVRYDWTEGSASNVYNPKIATNRVSGAHPRFGLLGDVPDWASIYGSYSEALGAVNAGLDPLGNPFKSEEARQCEVGLKADFLDKRLSATLAFYHLTKTNVLQPAAGLGAAIIYNLASGEVLSQGVGVDVIGKVTDQLSIVANYAHPDALVTKDFN